MDGLCIMFVLGAISYSSSSPNALPKPLDKLTINLQVGEGNVGGKYYESAIEGKSEDGNTNENGNEGSDNDYGHNKYKGMQKFRQKYIYRFESKEDCENVEQLRKDLPHIMYKKNGDEYSNEPCWVLRFASKSPRLRRSSDRFRKYVKALKAYVKGNNKEQNAKIMKKYAKSDDKWQEDMLALKKLMKKKMSDSENEEDEEKYTCDIRICQGRSLHIDTQT